MKQYGTNWRENAKILEEDILEEAMSRLKNYSKIDAMIDEVLSDKEKIDAFNNFTHRQNRADAGGGNC